MVGRVKGSKNINQKPLIKGIHTPPWRKKANAGLRLALREAGRKCGGPPEQWNAKGKAFLAEALGIKVQSLNYWTKVPRDRVMMVHMITGVPLNKLAPDLFK